VRHGQALGFRRRRQGATRQALFGGMQQRVRAQDAVQRRQRLGVAPGDFLDEQLGSDGNRRAASRTARKTRAPQKGMKSQRLSAS